ncbi:hypothetical protein [Tautonia plasticadhaerens]|nr:hypothetical protein [Tautonia plasticadhaerens]
MPAWQQLEHPRKEQLEQLLLSLGGERVVFPSCDPHLDEILDHGRTYDDYPVRHRPMERHRAHNNVAKLWYTSHGRTSIVTGYALSPDGSWLSLTWGLTNGEVVETSGERRSRYFGVDLDLEKSTRFAFANPYPGFMDRLRRDMDAGMGYLECLLLIAKVASAAGYVYGSGQAHRKPQR